MTEHATVNDLSAFLSTFAALLLENAWRFEETANRVTELVMSNGRPERELVIALQGFDRLKQEFEALGDALARYAELTMALPAADAERARLARDVIATISVADLKNRLLKQIDSYSTTNGAVKNPPRQKTDEEEIDVDVVF